jgi:hypothetical protein
MRTDSRGRQQAFWITALLAVMLILLLAGCGGSASSGGAGGTASAPTATPSPAPINVQGYGTDNGCPSDLVIKNAPSKANVTVQSTNVNDTIVAHNGDIIEVELPFGHKWTGPTDTQGVLQLQQPAGYAWKSGNICVWRFVATGTGTEKLGFSGQALCKNGQMCPMYIMAMSFTIDVK